MDNTCIDVPMIDETINSGTTIEIKIKTMDLQTHTLRVDKQIAVPALKEHVASVTGVVTEHQRLICRGRVLKDDQLLSAYHVEDGHTLHLVVRDPSVPLASNVATDSAHPGLGSDRHYYQVAPGVVVETLNLPGQGDPHLPDMGRILSAVLGSIGIPSPGHGDWTSALDASNLHNSPGEIFGDVMQTQAEEHDPRSQSDAPGQPNSEVPPIASAQPMQPPVPPVIPDAVTTLSQYLTHMRSEFVANVRAAEADAAAHVSLGMNGRESNHTSHSGNIPEGLPTPASLAELLLSTRDMLHGETGESLLQLGTQLQNQSSVTDPAARTSVQSSAWRTSVLLQNLGAYLFELGRTTMTLRLGRSPSEAVVNAGPAVFISPSGPNPLMVQPFPFQPGASFGTTTSGNPQSSPAALNGLGAELLPRRIDIQIRRGSFPRQAVPDGSQPSLGLTNPSSNANGEPPVNQSTPGTLNRGTTVRVLPLRTMIAVPDLNRPPPDSSGPSLGSFNPFLGRFRTETSSNLSFRAGTPASVGNQSNGTVQQGTPEVANQHVQDPTRNGRPPAPGSASRDQVVSRSMDINIVSSGRNNNDQSPDGAIPSSVVQFLRTLFPGGELHFENPSSDGSGGGSAQDHGRTNSTVTQETNPQATEEGIFFSRMLQQVIPVVSEIYEGQDVNAHTQAGNHDASSSRQRTDPDLDAPNAKRQKTE